MATARCIRCMVKIGHGIEGCGSKLCLSCQLLSCQPFQAMHMLSQPLISCQHPDMSVCIPGGSVQSQVHGLVVCENARRSKLDSVLRISPVRLEMSEVGISGSECLPISQHGRSIRLPREMLLQLWKLQP